MTFAFPILLGGLLLAGVPVLLHLLLRQKPKTVLFPAFRFLVQRHRRNLTKLRLRHILLMGMRMLLLAAIVLALAQPKVRDNPFGLPSDQAVAAVFVFDTSASMDYTVAASQSRLKDAQKRAVEMLKLLPANSEVVVLDSAEPSAPGKGDWLSREQAAVRIGQLTMQPANAPVSRRVEAALELLAKTAASRDENQRGKRPRVLCVFSDRTPASWDASSRKQLQAKANKVPPSFERLAAARAGIADQERLLEELEKGLPAIGQSFPAQPLIAQLKLLGERVTQLRAEDYPAESAQDLLERVREKQQDLLATLEKTDDAIGEPGKQYRAKLMTALGNSLRITSGFTAFYVDVGIDKPADLALVDWQLMRDSTQELKLRLEVQATGDDFRSTLAWQTTGAPVDRTLDVKAGKRELAEYVLRGSDLKVRAGQIKVTAKPNDQLAINNSRFLTYAFCRIVLIADKSNETEAMVLKSAIEAIRFGAAMYRCEIVQPALVASQALGTLDDCPALFMCNVRSPTEELWKMLADYVAKGGGLGVIPPDNVKDIDAYNKPRPAQELVPAELLDIVNAKGSGPDWDWKSANFKHQLMHPYQEWRLANPPLDFVKEPRGAVKYWQVQPRLGLVQVLVSYADAGNPPALLERILDQKRGRDGRVLLFTTLPARDDWNNYNRDGNAFFLTLVRQTIGYLSGDSHRPSLNFLCGEGAPRVPVRISGQAVIYKLYRDGAVGPTVSVTNVTVESAQNEVRLPQATEPGNYALRAGDDDTEPVARFSVNLPREESDLSKVPKGEIEAVLGEGSVLPMEARTDFKTAMEDRVSHPWEMMPLLMLGLLLLLAVENLLANKFYRRELVWRR